MTAGYSDTGEMLKSEYSIILDRQKSDCRIFWDKRNAIDSILGHLKIEHEALWTTKRRLLHILEQQESDC